MYSNSKFGDHKTTNSSRILAGSGASGNVVRGSEMTKIKIVNHNANSALLNANKNIHKISSNNEQHLILSNSHHSSRHSNIILSNKNSLLHRYISVYNYIIFFYDLTNQ